MRTKQEAIDFLRTALQRDMLALRQEIAARPMSWYFDYDEDIDRIQLELYNAGFQDHIIENAVDLIEQATHEY